MSTLIKAYKPDTGQAEGLHQGAGSLHVAEAFKPSSYDADLTMDGTGQAIALASGVKLGEGRVRVVNQGVTTEAIRVAFGTSSANAIANLGIAGALAVTGLWIGAAADGFDADIILAVPRTATHLAVANAVVSDTQVVNFTQGA